MADQQSSYRVLVTGPALRSLSKLSPRIAEPLVAFIFGSLAENPRRRGKPLRGEFPGLWSARRGDNRAIYELDEEILTVYVVDVGPSSRVYRRR